MPGTPRDEAAEDTYSRLNVEAMEAVGDIEIVRAHTPEAAAFDREMAAQLAEYDRDLVAREGPDALTSDRQLRQAAEQDAGLVASALASYRERLGLDRAGLAWWLGIGPDRLAALALSTRPDPTSATFAERIGQLADHYGADPGRLAEVLG